jgi:hypothetical protein
MPATGLDQRILAPKLGRIKDLLTTIRKPFPRGGRFLL